MRDRHCYYEYEVMVEAGRQLMKRPPGAMHAPEHGYDCGIYVKELTAADFKGIEESSPDVPAMLKIEDNGGHGDGVWITLLIHTNEGRKQVVRLTVPDTALEPLQAAFGQILEMRAKQKESEAR